MFSVITRKHVFAILTGKHFFVILGGKCVLGFWREKVVFYHGKKNVFVVLSVFVCDKNDIMFRFVICELHYGHNRHYTILNGSSHSNDPNWFS